MNILLTGGMGYIGSHVAIVLLEAGHHVVLYDNLCNSDAGVLARIAKITGKEPIFMEADVRATSTLTETLKNHAIEAVIHFAGLKAVGESTQKPLAYYANNVEGTISLLESMSEVGIRTLVFSGSATVYGEPQYLPLDEAHPTSATNPYGRTKLYIEEMLRDISLSDPSWRIVSLRYFNPAGAHESGLIGEKPTGAPNNLMPYMAQVATGELKELSVFGNDYPTPDGTGVRDYIHVMDLAEGHAAALSWLAGHFGWHAINLGTGEGYSVLDMIAAFAKASGRDIPYRIAPRRKGDVAACYADPGKALRELGWQARRRLHVMCEDVWRFQRRLPRP
ncbi:MAG: UDP-glucose 4-epimerase GalE [Betaproteobacteria bacterium]|nr:UDP-glucose 4-epimerase GalE [Betaproteobacteria bacterium]